MPLFLRGQQQGSNGGFVLAPGGVPATVDLKFDTDQGFNSPAIGNSTQFLTVSRASQGYAQDVAGNWFLFGNNVARRTNNGLLIEESRTNLFLNSQTPVTQTITVANTTVYTVSVVGTGTLTLSGAGSGTVSQGSPVTFTSSTTSLTVTTSGITGTFVNVNVEAGSFATSPIITAGASATRAADVITLTAPPAFSTSATIFAIGVPNSTSSNSANQRLLDVNDATNNNRLTLFRASGTGEASVQVSSASSVTFGTNSLSAWTTTGKLALSANAASNNAAYGGSLLTTDGAAAFPTSLTQVNIGSRSDGGILWNGTVLRIAIWSTTRISDNSIQGITT